MIKQRCLVRVIKMNWSTFVCLDDEYVSVIHDVCVCVDHTSDKIDLLLSA